MTTSQAYQADADRMAPDHDQAVLEDNLIERAADVAGPDPDRIAPESDQTGNEDPASHPVIVAAPAGPESAASTAYDYPGFTRQADGGAEEPEMADRSPGSPSLGSAAAIVPESVTDSYPASNTASPASNTTSAGGPWNEIQAMFVDDPRASIERAAGLMDDRVEELIQSVKERQHSMQSVWQTTDAGTEELRVALQHYRTFWNSLEDLSAQT